MKITWLGHSSFRLVESTGTTVVTDPYDAYIGYEMPEVSADIVTVSHSHRDHNKVSRVSGSPEILSHAGAYDISGVHIHVVKNPESHHRSALGVVHPIDQIADVVEIGGDPGQLDLMVVIAEDPQDLPRQIRHPADMGKAVFRKAKGGEGFVRPGDIGIDGGVPPQSLIGDHSCLHWISF